MESTPDKKRDDILKRLLDMPPEPKKKKVGPQRKRPKKKKP
jgi:hypothetical protein